MKKYIIKLLSIALLSGFAFGAQAEMNLSAETAGQTGVPGNVMGHMADVLGEKKIANLQVAQGQTLTNSVRNVAQGKTDIASAPIILPFLLSRGVGPYGKIGKKKGKPVWTYHDSRSVNSASFDGKDGSSIVTVSQSNFVRLFSDPTSSLSGDHVAPTCSVRHNNNTGRYLTVRVCVCVTL